MPDCIYKNPLQRSGTRKYKRVLQKRAMIRHVERQNVNRAVELSCGVGELFRVAAVEHQFGAGARQSLRKGQADALRRTRHKARRPLRSKRPRDTVSSIF